MLMNHLYDLEAIVQVACVNSPAVLGHALKRSIPRRSDPDMRDARGSGLLAAIATMPKANDCSRHIHPSRLTSTRCSSRCEANCSCCGVR